MHRHQVLMKALFNMNLFELGFVYEMRYYEIFTEVYFHTMNVWCEVIIKEEFHEKVSPASCILLKTFRLDIIWMILFHLKGPI